MYFVLRSRGRRIFGCSEEETDVLFKLLIITCRMTLCGQHKQKLCYIQMCYLHLYLLTLFGCECDSLTDDLTDGDGL